MSKEDELYENYNTQQDLQFCGCHFSFEVVLMEIFDSQDCTRVNTKGFHMIYSHK